MGSLIPQRKISVNLHACLSCFGGSAGLPVHVEGKPILYIILYYRYKRVQMVHILNKYVEYQYTVIPTLSP